MAKPQVFDRNMKRLAYLENAMSAGYNLETNFIWTATFTLPADDPKNKYCEALNYVEIYDGDERIDLFRIIGENLERGDGATRFYTCEHVIATLINDVLFQYHQIGGGQTRTPAVLSYILSKQTTKNWVLGRCDFDRKFEYAFQNSTLLAALFSVPECFDRDYLWEWDTKGYPWTLSLVEPSTALKSEIRYRKNLTGITRDKDASGLANRIYALGYGEGVNQLTISSVNNGSPYVEDANSIATYGLCASILTDTRYESAENLKAYAEQILRESSTPYYSYEVSAIDLFRLIGDKFSRFRPGDVIRVIDEEDGISLRTRIVNVSKDDAEGDPGAVTVTIANKAKDIAGSIADLQNRALIGETYAQGATNQQVYNFSDNADATHPATMRLYVSDSVVRINKMLLTLAFEPFRAFEQSLKGGGGQTTSSGGGSTTSSGGGSTTSSGGGQTTSSGGGATSGAASVKLTYQLPDENNQDMCHNHAIAPGTRLAIVNTQKEVIDWVKWVPSGAHTHGEHSHTIQPHTHTINAHTHQVSAHTHTVAEHTHGINFGIYEGQTARKAVIKVDGSEIPAQSSYDSIDIVEYLSKDDAGKIRRGTWHTIEILPDSMSRIVGAVFSQTFCNSRGGGDY